jgi:DNA ligase (NAD+)
MKERIKELETKIIEAKNAYYNTDHPIMSDQAFDTLVAELKELQPDNLLNKVIGSPIVKTEWKKAKHIIPMFSLDKCNLPEELTKWVNDTAPNERLCVCEKLDGLSLEVLFEKGNFVEAITRGDGEIGEAISPNAIKMRGVPKKLKSDFSGSLRGEIMMITSNHQKYFADKSNARNASSGIAKRLDGLGCEHLDVFFYQAIGDVDFKTEEEQFVWLRENGLQTPAFWFFDTVDEVNAHWRYYQDNVRDKLDYSIDGLVIRVSDMQKQMELGYGASKNPKWSIAMKFDKECKRSVIKDIIVQTGSSGRLTPVAIIEPVNLLGAMVERASLYNFAYINELGIDIGAEILITRSGDVIPRVMEVLNGTGSIFQPPDTCPECGSIPQMEGENLQCKNYLCPAQVKGRILNWIAVLNLLEWGETLVSKLVENNLVSDIADLYTLSIDELANIERMGKKSAKKCYDILHTNMELDLPTFIGGLSIPLIGKSSVKLLVDHGIDTLDKIMAATVEEFENIVGMGPVRSQSLYNGLREKEELIMELLNNGITIKDKVEGVLTGKSFCFTGTQVLKRAVLENIVLEKGGIVKNTCSKGTTYLVIADPNSTSTKATAAKKLGVTLITGEEFMQMAGENIEDYLEE